MGKNIKWPKHSTRRLCITTNLPTCTRKKTWVPHVEAARARLPSGSLTTFRWNRRSFPYMPLYRSLKKSKEVPSYDHTIIKFWSFPSLDRGQSDSSFGSLTTKEDRLLRGCQVKMPSLLVPGSHLNSFPCNQSVPTSKSGAQIVLLLELNLKVFLDVAICQKSFFLERSNPSSAASLGVHRSNIMRTQVLPLWIQNFILPQGSKTSSACLMLCLWSLDSLWTSANRNCVSPYAHPPQQLLVTIKAFMLLDDTRGLKLLCLNQGAHIAW